MCIMRSIKSHRYGSFKMKSRYITFQFNKRLKMSEPMGNCGGERGAMTQLFLTHVISNNDHLNLKAS